jgi:hypothetical protein
LCRARSGLSPAASCCDRRRRCSCSATCTLTNTSCKRLHAAACCTHHPTWCTPTGALAAVPTTVRATKTLRLPLPPYPQRVLDSRVCFGSALPHAAPSRETTP